jgi:hypothetical protein
VPLASAGRTGPTALWVHTQGTGGLLRNAFGAVNTAVIGTEVILSYDIQQYTWAYDRLLGKKDK